MAWIGNWIFLKQQIRSNRTLNLKCIWWLARAACRLSTSFPPWSGNAANSHSKHIHRILSIRLHFVYCDVLIRHSIWQHLWPEYFLIFFFFNICLCIWRFSFRNVRRGTENCMRAFCWRFVVYNRNSVALPDVANCSDKIDDLWSLVVWAYHMCVQLSCCVYTQNTISNVI